MYTDYIWTLTDTKDSKHKILSIAKMLLEQSIL